MNIFITGGTGFLGRWVVRCLLADSHRLLVLTRDKKLIKRNKKEKNLIYVSGDITNLNSLRKKIKIFRPQEAVCMAWEGIPNYDFDISFKNMTSNIILFRFLSEIGVKRIIFTGTQWEYGKTNSKKRETDSLDPINFIAAAKISVGFWGQKIMEEVGGQFVWLRLFSVYGPGQKSNSLVPHLVESYLQKKLPAIKNYSGGQDFVYVKDVAFCIAKFLRFPGVGGVFNVGSGKRTPIKKIIKLVTDKLSWQDFYKINVIKNGSPDLGIVSDISKIKKTIDWSPNSSIKKGMSEFLNEIENEQNQHKTTC